MQERAEVPFHGVPGRGEALRTILGVAAASRSGSSCSSRPTS